MRLLVTRPEADGERTAAALRAGGFDVLLAPLLRIETLAADLGPGPWSALVLTSVNAAPAVDRHPRRLELLRLPVFAVGRRTAEAARAIGFGDVTSADGDRQDLVGAIRTHHRGGPLLYLAGDDRAGDLAAELAADGVPIRTVVVYRAAKVANFPSAVAEALATGRLDGVLHFSRRSAEAYMTCAERAGIREQALRPCHYCLSAHVAEPLAAAGAGTIRIAPRPEERALIDVIKSSA